MYTHIRQTKHDFYFETTSSRSRSVGGGRQCEREQWSKKTNKLILKPFILIIINFIGKSCILRNAGMLLHHSQQPHAAQIRANVSFGLLVALRKKSRLCIKKNLIGPCFIVLLKLLLNLVFVHYFIPKLLLPLNFPLLCLDKAPDIQSVPETMIFCDLPPFCMSLRVSVNMMVFLIVAQATTWPHF